MASNIGCDLAWDFEVKASKYLLEADRKCVIQLYLVFYTTHVKKELNVSFSASQG